MVVYTRTNRHILITSTICPCHVLNSTFWDLLPALLMDSIQARKGPFLCFRAIPHLNGMANKVVLYFSVLLQSRLPKVGSGTSKELCNRKNMPRNIYRLVRFHFQNRQTRGKSHRDDWHEEFFFLVVQSARSKVRVCSSFQFFQIDICQHKYFLFIFCCKNRDLAATAWNPVNLREKNRVEKWHHFYQIVFWWQVWISVCFVGTDSVCSWYENRPGRSTRIIRVAGSGLNPVWKTNVLYAGQRSIIELNH